jgi:hypothetical protein
MRLKTVLAKRGMSIDLEYGLFKIEKGRTYTDDGTTIFDVYVSAGLADGSFEIAKPGPGTIVVSHPESRRRRR